MPAKNILDLLKDGDRRSIGRSDQVATMVSKNLQLFPKLIEGLWSKDTLVRMRAADAAEKVTRKKPELLTPYRKELLGLLGGDHGAGVALAFSRHSSTAIVEV